jgi:hypothetical protein
MTDFITRLAARTLGLMPVIQPIIGPIYAQKPSLIGNSIADIELEEIRDRETDVQVPPHTARQSIPRSDAIPPHPGVRYDLQAIAPPQPIVHHDPQAITPLKPPQITPDLHNSSLPDIESTASSRVEDTSSRILKMQEGYSSLQPIAQPVQRTTNKPDSEGPAVEEKPAPELHFMQPIATQINSSDNASNVSQPWLEENPSRPAQPGMISDVKSPSLPVTLPQIITFKEQKGTALENQYASKQEESSSMPIIRVTIGRIEVHATSPSTPHTQPKRSNPPIMSLDEYLNLRAKGGR